MTNYCHNCRYHTELASHSPYCQWCLDFWYSNKRWPASSDRQPTVIEQLYDELGIQR